MKNKLITILVILVVGIIVTACNGGGNSSPSPIPSPFAKYAYVATGGVINLCDVESNIRLVNCTSTASPIPSISDIVVDSLDQYAYISSGLDPLNNDYNLASCKISNNGIIDIQTCSKQSYSTYISGIALTSSYLYLVGASRFSGYDTANCSLSDHMLSNSCVGQTNVINAPQSAPTIASNGYFYVIGLDNNHYPQDYLQKCSISSKNGNLLNCQLTGGLFGDYNSWAGGLAIDSKSKFAYIVVSTNRHLNDTINICPIDQAGDISTTCINTQAKDVNGKNTLVLDLAPFNPTIFNNTLFIPNKGSNTVSACPLNFDGSLGVCTVSTLAQGTLYPSSISIY